MPSTVTETAVTTEADNLRNCRNCRWAQLNLGAAADERTAWNCVHPETRTRPPGPVDAQIQAWIDFWIDDFDDTGLPTNARDCPGWTHA